MALNTIKYFFDHFLYILVFFNHLDLSGLEDIVIAWVILACPSYVTPPYMICEEKTFNPTGNFTNTLW